MNTDKALAWAFRQGFESGQKHARGVDAAQAKIAKSDSPITVGVFRTEQQKTDAYRTGYNNGLFLALEYVRIQYGVFDVPTQNLIYEEKKQR